MKTIFDRLCHSGYTGFQIPPERTRAGAELEEADQIAAAIIEFYGLVTDSPPPGTSGPEQYAGPDREIEAPILEDIVLKALSSFVWTGEHDLLAHEVGHRQNFLHICVIGGFGSLLKFFLHHGYGDQQTQERRDEFGRTAGELAHQMERNNIKDLLHSTLPGPRPDPMDSYYQKMYAYALRFRIVLILYTSTTRYVAQTWLDLRQMGSETREVTWDPQPNGAWVKFKEPGFKRNDARVKVRGTALTCTLGWLHPL